MTRQAKAAVRQVLRKAGDTPHFFDKSEAERLVAMLELAFHAGCRFAQRRKARRAR